MPSDRTVVNEKEHRKGAGAAENLSAYGFDEAHYYITTSREKFDIDKVVEKLGQRGPRCEATILAKERSADYHIHFFLGADKRGIKMQIAYFQAELNPHEHWKDDGKNEVSAENFMEWLGRFFKYETSHAHLHVHYVFPAASRQSKVLPLPLKTSLEGDVEIDGVSVNLPRQPEGVTKIRLTLGEECWWVETVADRRLTFKKFALLNDVRALASVIDLVLQQRKS